MSEEPKCWKAWLSQAEFWYNTNFHTSLGCTPFKALYGYDPHFGVAPVVAVDTPEPTAEFVSQMEFQLSVLKRNLLQAQERMKLSADKNRTDVEYQVGDKVFLKLQPYVQSSLVNRSCPKLAMKYFGPYPVLERVGSAAYKLDLPPSSAIHPTFHVSQLKSFVPDHTPVFAELPGHAPLDIQDVQPELILDRRLVRKGNKAIPQVLIKWTGIPATSATWEDFYVVKSRFPEALAWGQASNAEGANVMPGGVL